MQEELRRKVVAALKHGLPIHVAMAKLGSTGTFGGCIGFSRPNKGCFVVETLMMAIRLSALQELPSAIAALRQV